MKKVVIDCDPGVDDAFALQFLLNSKSVEVLAITTVRGNCNPRQGAINAVRLLEANNIDVPVYIGQSRNFLPGPVQTPDGTFHGKDGFGDVLETKERTFPTQSAPDALVKIFNEQKDVDLIAIGPLTNLAVAFSLDFDLPKKIKSLTIMGGNMLGIGNNFQFTSEFNFFGDPEAAKCVLDNFPQHCPTTVSTWECCCFNAFPASIIPGPDSKTNVSKLLHAISRVYEQNKTDKSISAIYTRFDKEGTFQPDLLASIVYLYPEMVIEKESFSCTVELDGKYTRSMMIVDRLKSLLPNNAPVTLPIKFDMEKVLQLPEMKFE